MRQDGEPRSEAKDCAACGSAVYEVIHTWDWGKQSLLRVCSDPDCGTVTTEPAQWREGD